MDNGKSLIQLAAGFNKSPEGIAAETLEEILNRSQSARNALTSLVTQRLNEHIAPIASVKTQEEAGYPVDLVASDYQGMTRVILAPLFDAKIPYLNGGLNHCLNRLTDEGHSALLFVAPDERIWAVWRDMFPRVKDAGKVLPGNSWATLSASVDNSQRRLMLVSWSDLLNRIEYQTNSDPSVKTAVQELRDFTEFMGAARQLIDGAKNQGVDEGWARTRDGDSGPQGLIAVRFHYGFGRYVWLGGMSQEMWFGIKWQLWAKNPDTLPLVVWPVGKQQAMLESGSLPLEVYTDDQGHWIPVHLKPAAGYDGNISEVVRQLRNIAWAFRNAAPTD